MPETNFEQSGALTPSLEPRVDRNKSEMPAVFIGMILIHLSECLEKRIMLFRIDRLFETGNELFFVGMYARWKPKCAGGEVFVSKCTAMVKCTSTKEIQYPREMVQKFFRLRIEPTHERVR